MATVAKSGTPSMSTYQPEQAFVVGSGLKAGEALAAGDLVYIKSDGKFWKSNGTSANAAAKVRGVAVKACSVNESADVYCNVEMRYGAGMTPGIDLYAQTTAGLISDAATTGGSAPIGYVVDATRVFIHGSRY